MFISRLLLILCFVLFSAHAFSAITITSASGGSYSETETTGAITLYGGIAGTCPSTSSSSTCNSCVNTTAATACNLKSVHSSLQIGVTISSDANIANVPVIVRTGTSESDLVDIGSTTTVTFAASSPVTVSSGANWGDVCAADTNFGTSSCTPTSPDTTNGNHFSSSRKIYVWADENKNGTVDSGEQKTFSIKLHHISDASAALNSQAFCSAPDTAKFGMCGFLVGVGGDQKLFLEELYSTGSNGGEPQNLSGAPAWYGVALFYAAGVAPAAITNSTVTPLIKTFTSDYVLSDNTITGLTNYTQYCVLMANVNKAQNIFLFNTGGSTGNSCQTPSEVVGLLDNKSCFISTAAFGSELAQEVDTFRQFRNQFLIRNSLGSLFVKAYYQYSPPFATFIANYSPLRWLTRIFLYPLLGFVVLALQFGFLPAVFISLLTSLIAIFLFHRAKQNQLLQKLFEKIKNQTALNRFFSLLVFNFLLIHFISSPLQAAQVRSKKITHSGRAEGLIKIDKEGNYIYKPLPQNTQQTTHLKVGQLSNPEISTTICDENGSNCNTVKFSDIYSSSSGLGLEYDYEYYFTNRYGKLGAHLGLALQYSQGQGRLVSDPTISSNEKFSFLTVPLYAGAIYRFEYKDRQLLVPYVNGGGTYTVLAEKREDRSKINAIGAFGVYAAGGALFNLSALDRDMGSNFESEYGIENLWLSAELKVVRVESSVFLLQNAFVQGGIGFDF